MRTLIYAFATIVASTVASTADINDVMEKWTFQVRDQEGLGGWGQIYNLTYISDEIIESWLADEEIRSSRSKVARFREYLRSDQVHAFLLHFYTDKYSAITLAPVNQNVVLYDTNSSGQAHSPVEYSGNLNESAYGGDYYGFVVFQTPPNDVPFFSVSASFTDETVNFTCGTRRPCKRVYETQFSYLPNGVPERNRPKRGSPDFDVFLGLLEVVINLGLRIR